MLASAKASVEEYPSLAEKKSRFTMTKYLPILSWLPRYSRLKAASDLIAGISLGLTMIPQSIAYAALAGLTAQYGLYSCFVGGFLYIIFGTIKEVSIGPSSLMALVTLQYTRDMPVDFVVLLCFLVGCVEFLMGVLHLGFMVDFIPMPVTSGFISATSMIVIIAQLQGLLGLKYKSANIVDNLYKLFTNLGDVRLTDFSLGICSILFLLFFRKLKDINIPCVGDKRNAILKKIFWYISISRNALIVLIATAMAYRFETTGSSPFRLSGKIESGLPRVSLPPFSSQVGNETYTFFDMCAHYGSGMIILPLVSVLANVAIAKAFAMSAPVNATQEMLTLGLANILGSFVSAMPSTGAFTRSAVSNASGIQTPMAGLYSGTMALLALSFLTPYFYYIPRATLAAVLITAVVFMIDIKIIKVLWRETDAIAAIGTFLICVFVSVEIGLLLGVFFNLILFIRPSVRPTIRTTNCKTDLGDRYIMLKIDACLYYPAVMYFTDRVMSVARGRKDHVPLIVDCELFNHLDYTSIKGIETLSTELNRERNQFWLLRLNSDVVESIDILADSKYIRLIENKEIIANVLHDDALRSKELEDPDVKRLEMKVLSHGDFSDSNTKRKQSGISEEMTSMLPEQT